MTTQSPFVRWFSNLRLTDVPAVGGKNASLGELYSELAKEGIRVPDGFALTARAYREALTAAGAWEPLRALLTGFDHHDLAALAERAKKARQIVYEATGSSGLREHIAASYRALGRECGKNVAVAVRSSATAEDLPTASFAGQHETYLNVRGQVALFEACRQCFASIFTDRAIVYRIDNGFDHFKVALSVGVMKMVRSDLAASGVIFTLDTESGFRDAARYAHPAYAAGFALECAALRRVRDEMGLTNLLIMVPFCRRVAEGKQVIAEMARHGLGRGKNGLEIYVMCEIPNNVIAIDQFSELFDGFSIGSNDLTQLTLGVDRDSAIVAFDFDERDPGMLEMLRLAVTGAHRNRRHVGICGEAPANYPEIARFLAELGIDSISVNPASLLRTMTVVREAEQASAAAPRAAQ